MQQNAIDMKCNNALQGGISCHEHRAQPAATCGLVTQPPYHFVHNLCIFVLLYFCTCVFCIFVFLFYTFSLLLALVVWCLKLSTTHASKQ